MALPAGLQPVSLGTQVVARMLTLTGADTVTIRLEDLAPEDQMPPNCYRLPGLWLTPDGHERMAAALSYPCSEQLAAKLFVAMTVLLRPTSESSEERELRLGATAKRLACYPKLVVQAVLEHWGDTEQWVPAWADLKQRLDEAESAIRVYVAKGAWTR
ncbi:MAG: hypothetical protein VYB54_07630 [Pseudomonadota bacterium]|nr:hypothetical protein [Pseudomonadota bacterium]